MGIFGRKVRAMILMKNGDLVFCKKPYNVNKVRFDWGEVTFSFKDLFSRTPRIYGVIPVLFLKKHYLVIREGDLKPIDSGTLPSITGKDIIELAKSELLRRLGLDIPKERQAIQILILLGIMFIAMMELLRLAGVKIG